MWPSCHESVPIPGQRMRMRMRMPRVSRHLRSRQIRAAARGKPTVAVNKWQPNGRCSTTQRGSGHSGHSGQRAAGGLHRATRASSNPVAFTNTSAASQSTYMLPG